ncbi:MAG TPA: phage portal protein [Bosea sp. (in: a-proteobacteria)]|jgi:HK97 family phage portal protein|uniref:phage portal protein n=1 Tax=Bosea sp. (in: a-proteobacteria) TaxID=1871050 RepID=UPI002E14A000|nr:phage portal protein [Bosea sp. (in: a-proteobacteria)]
MRGFMGSLFGGQTKSDAGTTYGHVDDLWRDLFGGSASASGPRVTWKTALQVTTTLRCAAIIAEGICSIPWKIYQRVEVEGRIERKEAREHPLWDLVSTGPNDFQTSFEFREQVGLHLALCQNAYVFLNKVRGKIVEMIALEPGHVAVERNRDYSLSYRVTGIDGAQQTFPQETIWHIKGRSWNGYMGLETIALAREALGLALVTEESHARLHSNGARPSGVLSVEGNLDEKQFLFYRKWIDAHYKGVAKTGRTLITDRAAKWQSSQMTGVDAQHLQTRGFQIEEICRAMGVLPIMVGYTGEKGATYASAEQMFIAHVVHTVRPWHRRLEGSGDKWLLTKQDRDKGHYFGFVDNELVRGDMKTRFESYKSGIDSGWMAPEEPRAFEDMPYLPGLSRPRAPLNSAIVDKNGQIVRPPAASAAPNLTPQEDLP